MNDQMEVLLYVMSVVGDGITHARWSFIPLKVNVCRLDLALLLKVQVAATEMSTTNFD